MKLRMFPCPHCEQEKSESQYVINYGQLLDDLTFRSVCPAGHESVIVAEAQKFEVLFDMGIPALLDGYCREAVSSFAAAQERFHEFCIRVFLAALSVPQPEIDATWKLVASQSERQIGAYYYLHITNFKTAPTANRKMVEFRNSVIHAGHIPTEESAAAYGEYVYNSIVSTVKNLRVSLKPQIEQVCREDVAETLASIKKGIVTRTVPWYSMIWLSGPEEKFGRRPFRQALKESKDDHRLELDNRLEELAEELDYDDE